MPRVNHFIRQGIHTSDIALSGTAYNAAKKHTIDLDPDQTGNRFQGRLSALYISVKSVSGAATLTVRVTEDSGGDKCIMTDTAITLSDGTGITTATDSSGTIALDVDYVSTNSQDVYVFYKINAGTLTVEQARLTWTE